MNLRMHRRIAAVRSKGKARIAVRLKGEGFDKAHDAEMDYSGVRRVRGVEERKKQSYN